MRPWRAALLSAGVALACSQGCASDGEAAEPSPPAATAPPLPATPSVDDLGARLGCEVEDVEIRDRLPADRTADCRAGDQLVARLHTFQSEVEADVRSFFADRYPAGTLQPCPDGEAPQVPWVVLADSWAAVAPTRPAAETIATDLGGAVLVDFSADGPPVSYTYPADGLCPEA